MLKLAGSFFTVGSTPLEAQKVGHLHKELAAIVDEAIAGAQEIVVGIHAEVGIQVLDVAVVADVNRRARMNKVSDEKVGIEILRGR